MRCNFERFRGWAGSLPAGGGFPQCLLESLVLFLKHSGLAEFAAAGSLSARRREWSYWTRRWTSDSGQLEKVCVDRTAPALAYSNHKRRRIGNLHGLREGIAGP